MNISLEVSKEHLFGRQKLTDIQSSSMRVLSNCNSTFRGRNCCVMLTSLSRKSYTPISASSRSLCRFNPLSLRDIHASSSLVSLKFVNRGVTELEDIKLFKNLVNTLR